MTMIMSIKQDAMTDTERMELFDELVVTVKEAGLGWVVDEVKGLIAEEADHYTPWSCLDLLLTAVQRAISDTLLLEEALASFEASEHVSSADTSQVALTDTSQLDQRQQAYDALLRQVENIRQKASPTTEPAELPYPLRR